MFTVIWFDVVGDADYDAHITMTLLRRKIIGDIGEPLREVEFEPLTSPPVELPVPEPQAPETAPEPVPLKKPVPA